MSRFPQPYVVYGYPLIQSALANIVEGLNRPRRIFWSYFKNETLISIINEGKICSYHYFKRSYFALKICLISVQFFGPFMQTMEKMLKHRTYAKSLLDRIPIYCTKLLVS